MNIITLITKFNNRFAAIHDSTEISADEWFVIRDHITALRKEVEKLQWQMTQQD